MGESPFRNDDVYIFLEKLKMGCHLPIPSNCPENVYKVMEECWRISPEERPNWSSLTSQMHTLCASKVFFYSVNKIYFKNVFCLFSSCSTI
jgi:hypothetical protein